KRRQIVFVDWPELLEEQPRKRIPDAVECPAELDQKRGGKDHGRGGVEDASERKLGLAAGPGMTEQSSTNEQELPSKRIEVPDMTFGIGRYRDAEDLHDNVERRRREQHQERVALHADQHDREDHQHQNVKRQDVEKGWLELQEQ